MAAPVILVSRFNPYDAGDEVAFDFGVIARGATYIKVTWDPGESDTYDGDGVGVGGTYSFGAHDLLIEAENADGISSLAFDVFIGTNDADEQVYTGSSTSNNIIAGSNGNDTITGGSGIDVLSGRNGGDLLDGRAGDDLLTGDGGYFDPYGNDTLNGGSGADRQSGGLGSDTFVFTAGDVVAGEIIDGGDIDPPERMRQSGLVEAAAPASLNTLQLEGTVNFGLAKIYNINAIHFTGAGTAKFGSAQFGGLPEDPDYEGSGEIGLFEDSLVIGSVGINQLAFKLVADADIDLGALAFTSWKSSDTVVVTAGAGAHSITGSTVGDKITSDDGDDIIQGLAGDDRILGGNGDDVLNGNQGKDDLNGGGGDDVLLGKDGQDVIRVSAGEDVINGGTGRDTLDFGDLGGKVAIDLSEHSYTVPGGKEQTFIGIENVIGGAKADKLAGSDGNNVIKGGDGADTLTGKGGADSLHAGNDNDVDVFVYTSRSDSGETASTWDRIYNFDSQQGSEAVSDKINLKALNVSWSDIQISATDDVKVSIDTHGTSAPDMVIQVMGLTDLNKVDFIL